MKHRNPTVQAERQYLVEFGISMAAYALVLFGVESYMGHHTLAHVEVLILSLLPVVPIFGVLAAVIRATQRSDEFMRLITLQALSIAGGVTAMGAATYGFLEGAGLPRQSAWWTYTLFMVTWLIATFVIKWRSRA